jgi:hypothetical protein
MKPVNPLILYSRECGTEECGEATVYTIYDSNWLPVLMHRARGASPGMQMAHWLASKHHVSQDALYAFREGQ